MRLKRLELQGFKSFLDKTILDFERSITGVVGPNGCGKSNIVDAILWVMGEQSPKHLRGDSMTDVIFSGSDTKAATSMAEVSLILDREGAVFSPHLAPFATQDEISITRRIYRDGTGEFLINKHACRLKDIHELFMDTGVGRRAYSIIEQGQIDRMINVKPEDRRGIFEEVAGITKYKAKRKEAEKKLEQTQQNLTRLADILSELEKQMRSLKIQATRARKYREIKTELEQVDLFLLGRELFDLKNQFSSLQGKKDNWTEYRVEREAELSKLDADIAHQEIARIDEEKRVQTLAEQDKNLSIEIQKLENAVLLLEEKIQSLESLHAHQQEEYQDIQARLEEVDKELNEVNAEKSETETLIEDLEQELQRLEVSFLELKNTRNQLEKNASNLQQQLTSADQESLRASHKTDTLTEQETNLLSQLEKTHADLTLSVVQVDEQKQKLDGLIKSHEEVLENIKKEEANVAEVDSAFEATSKALSTAETELFNAKDKLQLERSRLTSLEELSQNLEGYAPSAKEILTKLEGWSSKVTLLAEALTPSKEHEELLESLLGDLMHALVVNTDEEAKNLSRDIQTHGLERVKILSLENSSKQLANLTPAANSLLHKIEVKAGFEVLAQWFLGQVDLVASPEELLSAHFTSNKTRAFSPELLGYQDTSLVCGKVSQKTGVFARRREIEELKNVCVGLELDVQAKQQVREDLFQKLKDQERLKLESKDRLSMLHVSSMERRKEREQGQYDLTRMDKQYSLLVEQSQSEQAQLQKVRSTLEECNQQLARLSEEKARLDVLVAENKTQFEEAATQLEGISQEVQEKKVELSRVSEKNENLEQRSLALSEDQAELQAKQEHLQKQLENYNAEKQEVAQKIEESKSRHKTAFDERNVLSVSLSSARDKYNELNQFLTEAREKRTTTESERNQAVAQLQEIELAAAQIQAETERLKSMAQERYQRECTEQDAEQQLAIELLPLLMEQSQENWTFLSAEERLMLLKEHVQNLKEKISRYGEVNLTAIQEFEEIEKRHQFLITQKNDLENSIQLLHQAIEKIDESTKIRFEETFHAVNTKFQEIFPILFNGGKAELTLLEGPSMLESGVDIMAQPPGKRLQSITLLSGGEKALTAVSLVLAIFARKPSPFCLLDEVDAPLDDANVSRFNTVIRKMAEKTQFIVITHNKKTMEIAESLYGVTMEKPGISKMTSVRLN